MSAYRIIVNFAVSMDIKEIIDRRHILPDESLALLCRSMELVHYPKGVSGSSWEIAFFPDGVKSLVRLMLQLSQFFVCDSAECFVRVPMTADPCPARFAEIALGAV